MPQLDISLFPSQIFWFCVAFGALFLYVRYFFLPNIEKIFSERNKNINANINLKIKLDEELRNLQDLCDQENADTDRVVSEMYNAMLIEHKMHEEGMLRQIESEFAAILRDTDRRILGLWEVFEQDRVELSIMTASVIINRIVNLRPSNIELRGYFEGGA